MKLLDSLLINSELSSGTFFPLLMRIGLSEHLNPYRLENKDKTILTNSRTLQLKSDTLEVLIDHCKELEFHPRKINLVKEFFIVLITLSEFIQAHTLDENLTSFAEIIKLIQKFDANHQIDDSQHASELFKLNQYIDRLDRRIIDGLIPGHHVKKYDALASCLSDYYKGQNLTEISKICNALKAKVMPDYHYINGKKIPAYPLSANSLYKKRCNDTAAETLKLEREFSPIR